MSKPKKTYDGVTRSWTGWYCQCCREKLTIEQKNYCPSCKELLERIASIHKAWEWRLRIRKQDPLFRAERERRVQALCDKWHPLLDTLTRMGVAS